MIRGAQTFSHDCMFCPSGVGWWSIRTVHQRYILINLQSILKWPLLWYIIEMMEVPIPRLWIENFTGYSLFRSRCLNFRIHIQTRNILGWFVWIPVISHKGQWYWSKMILNLKWLKETLLKEWQKSQKTGSTRSMPLCSTAGNGHGQQE